MKSVVFVGSSLDDLRRFPRDAKHDMGHQLAMVQRGMNPRDWRPMPSIGRGVRELRVRVAGNAYRSIYTTTIGDVVHILHVFVKKVAEDGEERHRDSQKTPEGGDGKNPIELVGSRMSILDLTLIWKITDGEYEVIR